MKGIILAGGTGSRLWPITISVSKQLLPVYDKPLVYYPLSTLMLAGVKEILIIANPKDKLAFEKIFGNGHHLGLDISYEIQNKPEGIAQSFLIAKTFIQTDKVCLILGDNIFHGNGLGRQLSKNTNVEGATIFGYEVDEPESYGVVEFDERNNIKSIEEKPSSPRSRYAIPGIYFFDNTVVQKAEKVQKSKRGEYEITSVLQMYLNAGNLNLEILPRGTAWMDCGTVESMNDAANYIKSIELRQGMKIGSIEEIAWRNGWITSSQLLEISKNSPENEYSCYLARIANLIQK